MGWIVVLIVLLGSFASAIQRMTLSFLVTQVVSDLDASASAIGSIFFAFLIGLAAGYVLMTIPTVAAGPRWGLVVCFAGVSLASFASAASSSVTALTVSRGALGFFTGGLLPAMIQAIRESFAPRIRPLLIGLLFTCATLAFAFLPLAAALEGTVGWRGLMAASGLPTLVLAGLCVFAWRPERPGAGDHRWTAASGASIAMLVLGLALTAPLSSFASSWAFTFARDAGGSDQLGSSGIVTSLSRIAGSLLVGLVAFASMGAGTSSRSIRAVLLTVCGIFLALTAVGGALNEWSPFLVFVPAAVLALEAWGVLLYSAVADCLPARSAAIGVAAGGLCFSLAMAGSSMRIGALIENSGYPTAFAVVAALATVAAAAVALIAWLVPLEARTDSTAPEEAMRSRERSFPEWFLS